MKILVTGATGYIGAHIVRRLAENGHRITATDFNWHQNEILEYVDEKVDWDIRTPARLGSFDTVVHLGAVTMVQPSVLNPLPYYETNTLGTYNVIQAADAGHFVYCSTGAAFSPQTSPYAMSKRAGEDFVVNLANFSICRFYNVGGNNGFKKFDDGHYHLIRKAAAVVNGLYPEIAVYGTDYNTRDGTTIRNYTHINDIVNAVIRIVDNGPTRNIECLGNTTGYTVLEVIEAMKRVTGKDFKVTYADRRRGDSEVSVIPKQSRFFKEEHTLEEQCLSTLEYEK